VYLLTALALLPSYLPIGFLEWCSCSKWIGFWVMCRDAMGFEYDIGSRIGKQLRKAFLADKNKIRFVDYVTSCHASRFNSCLVGWRWKRRRGVGVIIVNKV